MNEVHFFAAGPGNVEQLRRPISHYGRRCEWRQRYTLGRVEGTTRTKARAAIRAVLADPRSWERSGVAWVEAHRPALGNLRLDIAPAASSACGEGSAGCYAWGGEGLPVATVGVEYIDSLDEFASILNMELCAHGTFAMADMYDAKHQPYHGSLGTWPESMETRGYPTGGEIQAARDWLAGKTDPALIHE